jgi:hypothetical protein
MKNFMQKNKVLSVLGIAIVVVLIINILNPNFWKSIIGKVGPQQAAVINLPTPLNYWQFESSSNPKAPTAGSTQYPIADSNATFYRDSAACGRGAANQGCGHIALTSGVSSMTIPSSASLTMEMLYKLDPINGTSYIFRDTGTGNYAAIVWPTQDNGGEDIGSFEFQVNGDLLNIPFDGINNKDWSNFAGSDVWHHLALVYSSGYKGVFLDGQLIGSKTGGSGNFTTSGFYFGWSSVPYRMPNMMIDEVMITNINMDPLWVYQHYKDGVIDQVPYKTLTSQMNVSSVPTPLATTAGQDSMQFTPGHPTTSNQPVAHLQLQSFAAPRYNPNYTMPNNFPWLDYQWSGERMQHGSNDSFSLSDPNSGPAKSYYLQKELATTWNYMLNLPLGNGQKDCYAKALVDLANANPQWKVGTITHRAQPSGNGWDVQTYNSKFYLQNSSGGNLLVSALFGGSWQGKSVRPVWYSDTVTNYQQEGLDERGQIMYAVAAGGGCSGYAGLTRPIDLINENGENVAQLPMTFRDMSSDLGSQDPVVVSQKAAYPGGSGWTMARFVAEMFKEQISQAYRDKILLPTNSVITANTKYTEYALDGAPKYRWDWAGARSINTLKDPDGSYYATGDFYPKRPGHWFAYHGAFHGTEWIQDARKYEISVGDKFASAFISPGYNPGSPGTPDTDIRPAQWLGLLKIMGGLGNKFFYTGFFDETAPTTIISPRTYIWQYAAPSYAQAVMSRFGSAYDSSDVVTGTNGNMPLEYVANTTGNDGLFLATGDNQVLAVARKSGSKYLITTAWEQGHNMTLPINRRAKNIMVTVNGENLELETRVQGSTYIYDVTNSASPVFYQVDGWHEYNGPWYWSTDFSAEAEVFDSGSTAIKTEGPGVASRNFTPGMYDTYVAPASGNLTYKFQQRDDSGTGTSGTLYLWYRAKSATGSAVTASAKVDSGSASTLSISSNTYSWCNKNSAGSVISFPGVTNNVDHTFTFTGANSNFYFDKFVLSTNPNLGLGTCTGGGGGGDVTAPSISITGPTSSATYATSSSSITISGTASDDTLVTTVSAVNGATPITITGTASWSGTVSLASGVNNITVTAYDAAGNSSSDTIAITYTPPDAVNPVVTITGPTSSATYSTSTATMTLAGTASDNVAVTTVSAANAASGASAITISGTTSWTGTVTLVSGLNNITVTVFDATGNSSTDTIAVTYTPPDTTAPTVSITAPVASGGTYNATTNFLSTANGNALSGTAADNVGVTSVTCSNSLGGTCTVTGTNSWTVSSFALSNGANVLTVTAKDASNNTSTASITVNRDTQVPAVSMTAPANGATITGTSPITLTANATDNAAISYVEFYANGTLIGANTSFVGSNYSRTWTPTTGPMSLYAKAYDTSGNMTQSSTINITVTAGTPPDTTVPVVSMSAPTTGSTVSGATVTLGANATDNVGVASVAFYLDGVAISGAVDVTGGNPNLPATLYEAVWNTTSVSNGTHTLSAKATDAAGNNVMSSTISVTVNNVAGQADLVVTGVTMNPATVALGNAVSFIATVKNQGNAAAAAGTLKAVTFYVDTLNGSTVLCGDSYTGNIDAGASITVTSGDSSAVTNNWCNTTLSPTWTATAGAHTVYAVVDQNNVVPESDNTNNTLSKAFTVSTDTTAPTVAIATPTAAATYTATGATLATLSGTATDNTAVTQVTWANSLGGSGTATGTASWSVSNIALQIGTNVITVTGYDAAGNSSTDILTVTYTIVVADTVAPTTSFTSITGIPNLSVTQPYNVSNTTPVTFTVNATDNVGVTEVKFFLGGTTTTPKCTLTTPTSAPSTYSCTFTTGSIWSSKKVNVVAKDAAGNTSTTYVKIK